MTDTSPSALAPGARWREVDTSGHVIGFTLLRSSRRTIGFLITDAGLRVTAPRWVSLADVDNAVRSKTGWILAKLKSWHERQQRVAVQRTRWEDGGELPYLGKIIRFRAGGERRHFDGDTDAPNDHDILWLGLSPGSTQASSIQDAVHGWLQEQACDIMEQRLQHFLARSGLRIRKWRLAAPKTRWGSCTSQGNIMLNWRLVHFRLGVIDYVIAHELAHLRQMNHSPAFWAEVAALLPEYRQARETLRQHDPASLPSFIQG